MLRQSLLELMEHNPISKISVKELCEKADINRATFYRYYYDVFDLLAQIENELIKNIETTINFLERENPEKTIENVCVAIKENADLCNILFGKYGSSDFIIRILDIIHDNIVENWRDLDERIQEYLYVFMTNGSVGIIAAWQQQGFKESPQEIAKLINILSYSGLSGIVKADG